MKGYSIFVLCAVLVAAVFVVPAKSRPMPQTSFDNIKVLNDMSDADIRKEMMSWTEALGVQCSYCHVAGDFASEANPKKEVARKMVTMVKTINKDFLAGKAQCVLCHRGAAVPNPSI
jgi:hypothetical protein